MRGGGGGGGGGVWTPICRCWGCLWSPTTRVEIADIFGLSQGVEDTKQNFYP